MKEIDFIPQWYRDDRRRKVFYRRQYAAIIGVVLTMAVWSFITGHLVTQAQAEINRMQMLLAKNVRLGAEYENVEANLRQLQFQSEILDELAPKTTITSIIAELSFLITDNIILKSIDIQSEQFKPVSTVADVSVRLVRQTRQDDARSAMPKKDMVTKLVISGVAAGAQDVAGLISVLEASPYFCQIIPSFSKNKEIEGVLVTEFEIKCYLADYIENE